MNAATPAPAPIELATRTADASRRVARALAAHLRPGDLLVLDGPLGAGKTTFTQGLGEGLDVRGPVASPTFVIARVHPSLRGGPALVHVDAYRLSGIVEVDDLDLEAEMDEAVTVVEWGRGGVEHLSDSHLRIELQRPEGAESAEDLEAALAPLPTGGGPAEDQIDDPDEPRRLRFVPEGPRWDAQTVQRLRADLIEAATAGEDS